MFIGIVLKCLFLTHILSSCAGMVSSKDKEIEELKAKITEVLAVCPPTSFTNTTLDTTPIHYTSKLLPQVRIHPHTYTHSHTRTHTHF